MMQQRKYASIALSYLFLAGFAIFCVYGVCSVLHIANSAASLVGSILCLSGFAKYRYREENSKELKALQEGKVFG